jgi:hypothetical protein
LAHGDALAIAYEHALGFPATLLHHRRDREILRQEVLDGPDPRAVAGDSRGVFKSGRARDWQSPASSVAWGAESAA